MNIDVKSITAAMLDAVRAEVTDRWPAARALAEGELRKLASTFADVQKMLADREITLASARALIRMQENSARGVLRTVEGVSVLSSRRAIGAAMRIAASVVNPAIGAVVIRATSRATSTAASSEPTQGATAGFKAGKDR